MSPLQRLRWGLLGAGGLAFALCAEAGEWVAALAYGGLAVTWWCVIGSDA